MCQMAGVFAQLDRALIVKRLRNGGPEGWADRASQSRLQKMASGHQVMHYDVLADFADGQPRGGAVGSVTLLSGTGR